MHSILWDWWWDLITFYFYPLIIWALFVHHVYWTILFKSRHQSGLAFPHDLQQSSHMQVFLNSQPDFTAFLFHQREEEYSLYVCLTLLKTYVSKQKMVTALQLWILHQTERWLKQNSNNDSDVKHAVSEDTFSVLDGRV